MFLKLTIDEEKLSFWEDLSSIGDNNSNGALGPVALFKTRVVLILD